MRIIDNVNELLGDDMKAGVRPGSKLRIAASTFSIFAFEALKREFSQIKELEFIFTASSFNTARATDKPALGILGGQNSNVCLEFSGGLSQTCPVDVVLDVGVDGAKSRM